MTEKLPKVIRSNFARLALLINLSGGLKRQNLEQLLFSLGEGKLVQNKHGTDRLSRGLSKSMDHTI